MLIYIEKVNELSLDLFKKQLKEGKFSGVYLFCGEEAFLQEYYLNQLKNKLVDNTFKDFNYYYFEGKNMNSQQIGDAIESLPVMAEKKMLVIKDSGIFKSPKAAEKVFWESYLEDVPSYICIAFYEKEIDKRSKLYNLIKKNGLILEFKYQKAADLISWVARILNTYHKKMQKEDIYYLLQHCDAGMVSTKNEIDKLVYHAGNRNVITKEDIDAVCSKSIESKVFNMIDALMESRTQEAFLMLEDMKILKEPVVKILSLLSKQYADLLKVKLLLNQGGTNERIAKEIGIPPFAVKKHIQNAQRFSIGLLHNILQECLTMDTAIKTSKINDWLTLEMFIAQYGANK
ncbi:MAG: DNA polymerase III subunit delta [Clostridia bacterium]